MGTIVALAVLSEGVVVGLIAYVVYRRKREKLARCFKTKGVVVDIKQHGGGGEGGPTIHPVIRFRAEAGQDVLFESKYGSSNWKVKKGDSLDILVSRDNPGDAEVAAFMAQWGLPLVLSLASGGSLVFAPLVYVFMKH